MRQGPGDLHLSYADVSRVTKVHEYCSDISCELSKDRMEKLKIEWEEGKLKVSELPRPKKNGWSYTDDKPRNKRVRKKPLMYTPDSNKGSKHRKTRARGMGSKRKTRSARNMKTEEEMMPTDLNVSFDEYMQQDDGFNNAESSSDATETWKMLPERIKTQSTKALHKNKSRMQERLRELEKTVKRLSGKLSAMKQVKTKFKDHGGYHDEHDETDVSTDVNLDREKKKRRKGRKRKKSIGCKNGKTFQQVREVQPYLKMKSCSSSSDSSSRAAVTAVVKRLMKIARPTIRQSTSMQFRTIR